MMRASRLSWIGSRAQPADQGGGRSFGGLLPPDVHRPPQREPGGSERFPRGHLTTRKP